MQERKIDDLEVCESLDDRIVFSAFLDGIRSDPLTHFRFASPSQKRLCMYAAQGYETLLRGGNSSGKTTPGGAMAVALCRGLDQLAGIDLPKLRMPCVGWVLTQTYKQQVDSSQAAVLSFLGDHPHKIAWVSGETKGYVESIWIATPRCIHGMDERCPSCSRLVFHCAESQSSVGGRIDFAWADEPPEEKTWREIRMRGRGDQPFVRFITATPLERRLWRWMQEDFKDCEDVPKNGRIEVRTSIYDNTMLSSESLSDKLAAMDGDPFMKARIYGDYVDLEGNCPFDIPSLERWKARCVPPKVEDITIQAEKTFDDGRYLVSRICQVEVWEPPKEGVSYLAVIDPSSGVKSPKHDPAGIHIYSRTARPRLVWRFNDYLDPYGLGYLASIVCRKYGNALADIDMTGGYGANTVTALSQQKYYNLNRDRHEDRPGESPVRFGFTITAVNRSEITTSIVRALAEDSVDIPSSAVISNLMGITVNEKDKWLADKGRHDEDMICLGRALHLLSTMPAPPPKVASNTERIRRGLNIKTRRSLPVRSRRVRWNPA